MPYFPKTSRITLGNAPSSGISWQAINPADAELIANAVDREFDGPGNWSGTNWTVSGGKLQHTSGSTADAVLTSANMLSGAIVSNCIYKVIFTVSGRSAGSVSALIGTALSLVSASADGTYTIYLEPTVDDGSLIFRPTSDFDGALDSVSLVRVAVGVTINNRGFLGIGDRDPARALSIKIPDDTARSMVALWNPSTFNDNGVLMSFRTDTTGAGGGSFREVGAIRFKFVEHNHATRSTEMAFFSAAAGSLVQVFTISSNGYAGIRQVSPTAFLHLPAGVTAAAPLRIPHGVAPTSPNDGDIWTTTAGLFVRINGVTVGPLS